LPAKTTLDSQAAKDGVFSAARVVLGRLAPLEAGLALSRKAVMPSFWSSVENSAANMIAS
jgi:hypothetical protein